VSTATADRALSHNRPRQRLLVALLAVSLALNLFFIAGAAWTRLHPPPAASGFDERFSRMAAQLDLRSEQQAAFTRYQAAMRARRAAMRQKIRPLIDAVRQEIARPQPDVAHIQLLLDDATAAHRAFQRQAIADTLAFVATLSPAQRATFLAIESHHWGRHPPRR
jgi:Spy/CpxP family protein refolding chaperone